MHLNALMAAGRACDVSIDVPHMLVYMSWDAPLGKVESVLVRNLRTLRVVIVSASSGAGSPQLFWTKAH